MGNRKQEVIRFNNFINEELEQTIENMEGTTNAYTKYKAKVMSMADEKDINKSQEDFEAFIDSLPDEEKSATDMLRSLFSSEMMQISIKKLEDDKKRIEEQIKNRLEELKNIQSKLK